MLGNRKRGILGGHLDGVESLLEILFIFQQLNNGFYLSFGCAAHL